MGKKDSKKQQSKKSAKATGKSFAIGSRTLTGWSIGVPLLALIAVVLGYQLVGGLIEWAMTGSLASALQDWKLGWPGMLLQAFGGWLVINLMLRK